MPIYPIKAPDGTIFRIKGDSPPTEQELETIYSNLPQSQQNVPRGTVQTSPGQGVLAGDSPYKDVIEAIPFSNAPSEFRAGQRSGNQIFGNNIAGDVAGGVLGWGRALGSMLNPVGKTIGLVPKVTQAGGAAAGGDLNAALQALTGSSPITSAAEINPVNTGSTNLDTLINGLTGTYNEALAKQPLSLLGLTPKGLAAQGSALRGLPGAIAEAGNAARSAKSAFKGEIPIDPQAVEAAQKRVQNLEFLIEQNRINKTKTAELRNADNLILQEDLAKAQGEADTLRAEALKANQELGPQIELLNQASAEAPNLVGRITARLPPRQGEAQFGTSIEEGIANTKNEAKPSAQEDYSAVRDAADPNFRIETPEVEQVAQKILSDKKAGYSAALRRVLKSVLGESVERTPIDPLKQLSAATRDIYERLPDAQKQSFLDQAGLKLGESQPKTYSWNELEQRYKDLNGFIEEAKKNSPTDVMYFTRLKNALSNEMSKFAEASSTDVKALFDEANANYAANAERFGAVESLSKGSPESIAAKIVGEDKASTIEALKQVLSPEKFEQVQSQYAHELFSPSKGVPFEAAHFLKTFEKFSDETLRSAFGKEGLAELYRIKDLAESAGKADVLKSQLDEYNSKAQNAENAFQKAKSAAEEKAVTDSIRAEAEAALDAIKDEKFKNDIEKARAELQKANTPQKISKIVRLLYATGSLASAVAVGASPGVALSAAIAAAAFSRTIHRNAGSIITDFLAKKQMAKENK